MANDDNLKGHGFHERTASEQREIASKGGIASGKSRREQAAFRDFFNSVLDEDGGKYNGETISKKKLIAIKALKYLLDENELSAHEFARMFEIVRDTIGEKPIDKVQFSEVDQSVIDEIEAMMAETEEEPAHYDGETKTSI